MPARQLGLGLNTWTPQPQISNIACYVCGRLTSIWIWGTRQFICKRCNAIHNIEWKGTERLPTYAAIVDIDNVPKEYMDALNIHPENSDDRQEPQQPS